MIQPRPFPGSIHVSPQGCRRSLTLEECTNLVPGDEVLVKIDPRVFTVVSNDGETLTVVLDQTHDMYSSLAAWEILETLIETETV
jgi:hypothetical protein